MNEMPFIHSGIVPPDFALAVRAIMCNQATSLHWQLIDQYEAQNKPIMVWINSILHSNEPDISDEKLGKELVWWRTEIDKK